MAAGHYGLNSGIIVPSYFAELLPMIRFSIFKEDIEIKSEDFSGELNQEMPEIMRFNFSERELRNKDNESGLNRLSGFD